jgi:hypothetical protein
MCASPFERAAWIFLTLELMQMERAGRLGVNPRFPDQVLFDHVNRRART